MTNFGQFTICLSFVPVSDPTGARQRSQRHRSAMTRLSRLAAPTASLRSMLFRPCRASFSQSRDGAYSTAKKAFLLFAEVSQGCQKSRQISRAAPALSLSWRHPRVAASTAGGGWGYPADTKTRLFYDCVPCGRADTAIGFVPFENAFFRNRKGLARGLVHHLSGLRTREIDP